MKRIVHIVGTGTIGEPLIGLFTDFSDRMGIDEVTFHKRTPLDSDRSRIKHLMDRGAKLATDRDRVHSFEKLGHKVSYEAEDALERATAQLLDRHTRAATQSFHAVLVGHDLRPEIGTAEIHRSGGSLQVTLRVTEELPEGVAEVSAVRATGAVRDVDPYASTIDVEVVVAQ